MTRNSYHAILACDMALYLQIFSILFLVPERITFLHEVYCANERNTEIISTLQLVMS
jgi:hypothetical protein